MAAFFIAEINKIFIQMVLTTYTRGSILSIEVKTTAHEKEKKMEKVMEVLKNRTLEELVGDFEATEENNDSSIYQVRGWLMEEIEKRNPTGYDNWLESENCSDKELRNYVL